ncbi:hypothetical protein OH76DRAFT_1348352 [Lentinus brumalis]|uniref:Fungal-type protein kinase domain-containing protein n=1 Tax=Lentinus brumalis TaxID=2498619 RepID=A0A371DDL2_9APHY|nr:hypothetical protein OH76DRAFT_1348352 [Polyporus brumalis]
MVDPRRTNDEARDIIESVVREVFARQPRRWIYSIHLLEGGLYCFRRDRSGTIVSKDVAMAEDPGMLVRLLWRFSQMTDEQLGLDLTASTVDLGSPYFALMEDTKEDKDGQDIDLDACEMDPFQNDHRQPSSTGPCVFAYQRRLFADSLTDDWPRYALEVGTERRKYLVGKPTYIADAHSTGTLVYIALDPVDRSFVTLKDKWRPLSADFESEGDILRTLQSRGVGGVPSAVRYGDIEGHQTWLELYSEENVRRKRKRDDKGTYKTPRPFERLQHCRLVEKEVFLPLDEFTCSFQLLRVISDCIRIHRASYEAGYLQRDVNPSNIMIRPSVSVNADGKRTVHYTGVLIDWDLACRVQEGRSVQPYPPKPRSLVSSTTTVLEYSTDHTFR